MNLKSTASEPGKFFITPQGTHKHSTWSCARTHQPVGAPEPMATVKTDLAACSECCSADEVTASETAAQAKADAYCTNSGLVPANPHRLYRVCADCGYEGKVGRNGLRAHKPQK
jgi:hypothetical protein